MSDNKKTKNAKKIEDFDLEKIIGGTTLDDTDSNLEEVIELAGNVGKTVQNLSNTLELVYKAAETNTCPFCNDKILPLADKCKPSDFLKHAKIKHYSK